MYGQALREVNEVLENMDEKYTKLISPDFMKMMIENIDWSYDFKYDTNKKLDEQLISDEAKTILSIIYLRYFTTKEEREKLTKILRQNDIEKENFKREKYNVDKIFEKEKNKNINKQEIKTTSLVKVPEKWYQKIFNKIKSFFKHTK
ncbi:MAG TPA: hypothetical protein OIM45_01705 [Clostridiaceae bacterium]|nr:hypothetical protein [Clostridiaceae bacterium]